MNFKCYSDDCYEMVITCIVHLLFIHHIAIVTVQFGTMNISVTKCSLTSVRLLEN
jgi:hypothetical protein